MIKQTIKKLRLVKDLMILNALMVQKIVLSG
jgi:hypothetical protein